jgi:hydrogenase/urease accessory protein HupE
VFALSRRPFLVIVTFLFLLLTVPVSAHNLPMGGSRWCFSKNGIVGNIDLNSYLLGEIGAIKEGHVDVDSLSDEQLKRIATGVLQPYIDKKLTITVGGEIYPVKVTGLVRDGGTYTIWLSVDHISFDDPMNLVRINYGLLFDETSNSHVNLAYGYLSDATGAALQKVFNFQPPAFQTTFDHNAPVWELAIKGIVKATPAPKPEPETPSPSAGAVSAADASPQKKCAALPHVIGTRTGCPVASAPGSKSSASAKDPTYSQSSLPVSSTGKASEGSLWSGIGRFLVLGIEHILTGYDHITFLLALIVIGLSLKEVLRIITAFTAAHSITLLLSALRIVSLNSRIVESAIALSICYVAVENIFTKDVKYRWIVTFGFGLVHGFGFASALQELIVGRANLLVSVLSFNAGVEIGQLMIISAMLPLLYMLKKHLEFRVITRAASAAIFVIGFTWLIERAFDLKVPVF